MTVRSQIANRNGTQPDYIALKIRKVGAGRHPTIVGRAPISRGSGDRSRRSRGRGASAAARSRRSRDCDRSHALEDANVSAVRARVLVIQKPARVLLAQGDGLVQRVVRKRGQRHGVRRLVLRVQRIGLQHVVVAVHVPVFGDDNPFARAPRHGAPRIRRSTTGHIQIMCCYNGML